MTHYLGLIEHYRDRLPVDANTPVISLNEGNTPLIELVNLPSRIGKRVRIYAKFEGLNHRIVQRSRHDHGGHQSG